MIKGQTGTYNNHIGTKTDVLTKKEESKNQAQPSSYSNSNVVVAIRCRPLSSNEQKLSSVETVKVLNGNIVCIVEKIDQPQKTKSQQTKEQQFFYDIVFDKRATQKQVYDNSTKFLLPGVLDGFNATVFAYGATGSGKTYTMLGTQNEPGIIQRAVTDLFALVKKNRGNEIKIRLSYIEIYNEFIHDLLGNTEANLELREDPNRGLLINGINEIDLDNTNNFFNLLLLGNSKRVTETTDINTTSSRSHAVLQIFLENKKPNGKEIATSRFVLVDLAGSEKNVGVGQRKFESSSINRSLLNLGKCITALADNRTFVSWRDSKLTRILKDSLIGNSRMVMISTITPSIFAITETINTLLYSSRAKNIQTKVKRNTVDVENNIGKYEEVISGLAKELENLRFQLSKKTHNQYLGSPQPNKGINSPTNNNKVEKLFKEIALHFNEEVRLKNEIFEAEKMINGIELSIKEKEFQLFKSINKKGGKSSGSSMMTIKDKEIKSQINKLSETLNLQRANLESKESKYNEFAKKRENFENIIKKYNNDKTGANLSYLFNSYVFEINNMTNEHLRRQNLNLLKQKELKIQKLVEQLRIRDEYISSEKTEIQKKKINFKYENEAQIKKIEEINVDKSFTLPVVIQQNDSFVQTKFQEETHKKTQSPFKGRFPSAGHYDYSGYSNPNIIKQKQIFNTKTDQIMRMNKRNELSQLKLNVLNDRFKGSKVLYVNNLNNRQISNEDSIVINFDSKPLNKSHSNLSLNDSGAKSNENSRLGLNDRSILNKVKRVMVNKKRISPYMK